MNVNAVIAEYNPFHNGHRYHLEEAGRLTGADYTIVVMSGDFVQRGAPALTDKHLRTRMALSCGADLVLELPVLYAASSAEFFAAGAVALLDKLGVVNHLCFGSEGGDGAGLEKIALALMEESDEYRAVLKEGLKKGLSYPAARSRALSGQENTPSLTGPNNILGVEYIRALHKRHSAVRPVAIKRKGAGYHDVLPDMSAGLQKPRPGEIPGLPLAESEGGEGSFRKDSLPSCSARAIRQALQEGYSPLRLDPYMPPEARTLLLAWMKERKLLYPDDFSSVLYYKLLTEKEFGYEKYLDMSSDLSDRIRNKLGKFTGYEAFCDLLKTKNMTHTRISRCLLHILLGIEKKHMELGKSLDYASYARILGFRKSAGPLLGAIKAHTSVPLISKLADAEKILSPEVCRLLSLDIMAAEIYKGILYAETGCAPPCEYAVPPVIL